MNGKDWLPMLIVLLPALAVWVVAGYDIALSRARYEIKRRYAK